LPRSTDPDTDSRLLGPEEPEALNVVNPPPVADVQTPDGAVYHTITYGKGLMGPYGANITVQDRWAIVAYVRALQKAQPAGTAVGAP
jgi:hypothetical protein